MTPDQVTVSSRLIMIRHERCHDYAGLTFALAPLEWTGKQTADAIDRARAAYIAALELAKAKDPAPPYPYETSSFYEKYPEKTVAEVKTLLDEQRAAHDVWRERRRQTKRKFYDFLIDEGFVSFYDDRAGIPSFDVSWGHRHGLGIDYSETELDTLPPPIKIADPEYNDYDDADFG